MDRRSGRSAFVRLSRCRLIRAGSPKRRSKTSPRLLRSCSSSARLFSSVTPFGTGGNGRTNHVSADLGIEAVLRVVLNIGEVVARLLLPERDVIAVTASVGDALEVQAMNAATQLLDT